MIIATTENLPGHRVTRVIGQVFGLTVRTRGLGGNIAAAFRSVAGGEVASYTKLLEDTRRQALNVYRMKLLGGTVVPVTSGTKSRCELGTSTSTCTVPGVGRVTVTVALGAPAPCQANSERR